MARPAKETLVNPIAAATMATVASVGTVGSVGQMGFGAEEVEPEESSSEVSADPEWAAELSQAQERLRILEAASQAEKAEVLRVLEEDAKRQARFPGVDIGYFEDENGKLIKRKASGKRTVWEEVPARAYQTMSQEDRDRIYRNRDQRHTRFWYARQLASFIDGELKLSREQYHALLSFGRMRGWNKKHSPAKG